MAERQKAKAEPRYGENQVIVTARRALGLSRFYLVYAVIIGIGLLIFNPTYVNVSNLTSTTGIVSGAVSAKTGIPLLAVPFSVLPMMMLTTPMVILFVYDKNSGMLEYLLSLGMTQRDTYLRYLKAALLNGIVYLVVFGTLDMLYSYLRFGTEYFSTTGTVLAVGALISVSTVAFIINVMMVFSSLQKSRAGGNQPLAITLGLVGVFPGYFIPFLFQYNAAIEVEIVQGALIAAVALILVGLSGKLVKREKFLPA